MIDPKQIDPRAPSLRQVLSALGLRRDRNRLFDELGECIFDLTPNNPNNTHRSLAAEVWFWLEYDHLPSIGVDAHEVTPWWHHGELPAVLR